jgi:hypothetical protein
MLKSWTAGFTACCCVLSISPLWAAEKGCADGYPCVGASAFPDPKVSTATAPGTVAPSPTGFPPFPGASNPAATSSPESLPPPVLGAPLSPSRWDVITERYPSGELLAERKTYDGKLDGVSKEYYKNGQVMNEWNYKRGVLQGESVAYYRTGDIMTESTYRDGKLNGKVFHYGPRKILKSVETYKNGVLISEKSTQ